MEIVFLVSYFLQPIVLILRWFMKQFSTSILLFEKKHLHFKTDKNFYVN